MNERIKELLGQAYDQAVPETWTTLSSEQLGRVYGKFAELIVSEFIKEPIAWTRTDTPAPIIHEEMMQKHPELRQYFPVPLYYGPQE